MAALVRVQIVYNTCLYMFPKFKYRQYRQLANIVTGNETGVHHFEPGREIENKIWQTFAKIWQK